MALTVGPGKTICRLILSAGLGFWLLAGCSQPPTEEGVMTLSISSAAFKEGDRIPDKYTCDGQDVSPPLAWDGAPAGTVSLALILDDPDAPGGVFTHWLLFNIPASSRSLPEAVPAQATLPGGALQAKNDFGGAGYGGPCPPRGSKHRYQFNVYALDRTLDLKVTASKNSCLTPCRDIYWPRDGSRAPTSVDLGLLAP